MGLFTPHRGCRGVAVWFEQLRPGLHSTSLNGPRRPGDHCEGSAMGGKGGWGAEEGWETRPLQGQFC